MWKNSRITERKGNPNVSRVSSDWVIDEVVLYTHSKLVDTTDTAERDLFKLEANQAKDAYLAKVARESALSTQIDNFLNL